VLVVTRFLQRYLARGARAKVLDQRLVLGVVEEAV
jgi:hypothetical protein